MTVFEYVRPIFVRRLSLIVLTLATVSLTGCSGCTDTPSSGTDAALSEDAGVDTAEPDVSPQDTRPAEDVCTPAEEACDGEDNDCDGVVDEECPCAYEGNPEGVCGQSVRDPQTGRCQAPDFYQATEDLCDGRDNDCDGQADAHCECQEGDSEPCYTGPPGTEDVGTCTGGTRVCENGQWSLCQGEVIPVQNELCGDGADDDCNGVVDDNCGCNFQGSDVGVCANGRQNDQTQTCDAPLDYEPEETLCDGRDNDCDGESEEFLFVHEDFEGADPEWAKFTTNKDWFTASADATDSAHGGSEAGKASSDCHGVCGYGGLARDFSLSNPPKTLTLWMKADVDPWGRANILVVDSNGRHDLWSRKGQGSAYTMDWTEMSFDLTGIEKDFKLVIGNADNSQPWCREHCDHKWTIWFDDITIEQRCVKQ